MPFLFWLDSAIYLLSVILSMAICLAVLGADPGKKINQFFALFCFFAACWAFSSLMLRMSMWLEIGNWELYAQLATLFFTLLGPILLLFAVRYVGWKIRAWDIVAGVSVVFCFAMMPFLLNGQVIRTHSFHESGATHLLLMPLGLVLSFLPLVFFLVVLFIFWKERKNLKEKFISFSVIFLLAGMILGVVVDIGVPVMSFTILTSVSILGYAVLRRQLFNPLKKKNLELQHEIAERLRTEEALRQSEANMKALVSGVPDAILHLDSGGTVLNSSHPEIVRADLQPDAVTGVSLERLFPGETVFGLAERIAKTQETGETELYEFLVEEGWAKRYFEARIVRVREREVILLIRNVTARKDLEDRVSQSNKMEAVGRLAGGVAHDFNNILTITLSLADLGLYESDIDVIKKYLQEIVRGSLKAAELTRELLAYSKKQVLITKIVDLNPIIAELEPMLKRLLGEDISLSLSLDPSTGSVRLDPVQFRQVIMNLAVNSRDALPKGGLIGISTEAFEVPESGQVQRGLRPGAYTRVLFKDSGVGIDKEILGQIFEPFFTTKKDGRGTGLGLATVHGIVTQSNGHIFVESGMDAGTTFEILFPVVENGSKQGVGPNRHELSPPSKTNGANERIGATASSSVRGTILIVEDEEAIRVSCQRMLMNSGFDVIVCANADEALRHLEDPAFVVDVLLTDVVMPGGKDGIELTSQIKATRKEIKIILMSGYANDVLRKHGTLPAEVSFLEKPFGMEKLLKKIGEALGSK